MRRTAEALPEKNCAAAIFACAFFRVPGLFKISFVPFWHGKERIFIMQKRILGVLLSLSMLISSAPPFAAAAEANAGSGGGAASGAYRVSAGESEKSNIDKTAYEAMGFNNLDAQNDDDSFFGAGNTVLMPKRELYIDFHGSSNYGRNLRSGINLSKDVSSLKDSGAYKRYGQYQDPKGKWAHLDEKNGYSMGRLGGTDLYKSVTSKNGHKRKAYATSVAFNSGSGRDSNVATVYIKTSDSKRANQSVCLEINRFLNEGKTLITNTYTVASKEEIAALDESGYFYSQEFDALIDVAAGDFNGDGKDEIAVYAANNKVKIYQYTYSGWRLWKEINDFYTDSGISASGDTYSSVKRAAVVTLEAFDLDKNNADELVITVTNPQSTPGERYKLMNYGYVYGYSKKTSGLYQAAKVPLYDSSSVLRYASATAGDFTGSGCPILIFGGRLSAASSPDSIGNKMGTIIVEYDHSGACYNYGEIQKHNENFDGELAAGRGIKYYAPIGLAAFNMYGGDDGERLFLFNRIYKYEGGAFKDDGTTLNYTRSQKNNADEDAKKDQTWVSDVITGNFTKQDIGRKEQLIAVVGVKQMGDDRYWYQMAYISADNSGRVHTGWEGVLNQGTSYFNTTENSREGSYVTICAPDVDEDSMLLKFKGSETYYSKPEVQAIMQSAPFFEDVADVYDDYLNNGATAYGKGEGNTKGVTASIETSLGVYTSEEASLGGAAEFEASIAAVASYEHQSTWSKETSVEYAGGIGDDYVVMYTVPFHRYVYDGWDAKNKKYVPVVIEEPLTPVTVIVTVDKYDEIASQYNGLEPIRGNVLKSTPGDPSSYQAWGKGDFKRIGELQMLTNAGKGNGSTVTVSQTATTEHENSFAVGIEENLKAGGGAGFLGNNVKAGVVQSMTATVGGVFSNMNGVTYTGTVDNLPEGVSDFAFQWEFGFSEIKFNGEDVVVIGYKTKNVKRAPKAPKNVAITDIGDDFMTLEWDKSSEAALYELSFITGSGEELPLANIPGTTEKNGVVSYTVKNLNPATEYRFVVRTANAYGVRSLPSQQVIGTTLSVGDSEFSITEQPKNQTIAVGHDVTFSVSANSTSSEIIRYIWYKYNSEERTWEQFGGNSRELTFTADESMDGSRYRCTVYQGTKVLNSKSAELTIGLSPSSTTMEILSDGNPLKDFSSVKADYEEQVKTQGEEITWENSKLLNSADGKTYKKLAVSETISEDADGNLVYSYAEPYLWALEETNADGIETGVEYYAYDNGGVGAKYDVTERLIFTSEDKNIRTLTTEETFAKAVDIGGKSCLSGYKYADGTGYIYIYLNKTTDSENNEVTVTEYYAADGTRFELGTEERTIEIAKTTYFVDELAEVKEQVKRSVDIYETKSVDGKEIILSADVAEGRNPINKGTVNFRIVNTSTGDVEIVSVEYEKSGKWEAAYRFPSAGIYEINAVYSGSEEYKSSASGKITVYAYNDAKVLNINGGRIVYGSGFDLNPVLINGTESSAAAVTYTVKKFGKVKEVVDGKEVEKDSWLPSSLKITNDRFMPDSTGKYQIIAEYEAEGITATAIIDVAERTVTITPKQVVGNLKESEEDRRNKLSADVTGILSSDRNALEYKLVSGAVDAKTKGDYSIEVTELNSNKFEGKYNFVTDRSTFTLEQGKVTVGASAKANGSVSISYVTDKFDETGKQTGKSTPLTVESGTQIPEGADVTFRAQPNPGFGVDKWTVSDDKDYGKALEFTIENISSSVNANVSFTYAANSISFYAADENGNEAEDCGSVSGAYEDGQSFNSGDKLIGKRNVVLTASPAEGYVVAGWQKYDAASGAWENIKISGSTENDTSLTYKISGISSSASYRVLFAQKVQKTVTFTIVDASNNPVTSAEVLVNGAKAEMSGGKATYSAYEHEVLAVEIKIPDSVLIKYWENSAGTTVADNVNRYTIYDLKDSEDYKIYCEIPNERTVIFSAEVSDGSEIGANALTAMRVGGGAVVSGTVQPQSAQIEFTAVPADGYRVKEWRLNGNKILGEDTLKYVLTVDNTANVKVIFEKKPIVSVASNAAEGIVTTDSGNKAIQNGGYVEFNSDVLFTIAPKNGYVIDSARLNGTDITDSLSVVANAPDSKYYKAENVTENQNLVVSYKHKPIVSLNKGTGGSVEMRGTRDYAVGLIASGDYVDFGSGLTIDIKSDLGYIPESVTVDGVSKAFTLSETDDDITVSVAGINSDKNIAVKFKALAEYSIAFNVIDTNGEDAGGTNGMVSASVSRKNMDSYKKTEASAVAGTVSGIYEGGSVIFVASSDADYRIKEWTVDGAVLTYNNETFTGNTLTIDGSKLEEYNGKTINVQFEEGAGRVSFLQPANGVLTAVSAGTDFVSGGSTKADVTFTLVPNEHYVLKSWRLNGNDLDGETELTYLFTPNGRDATIEAVLQKEKLSITAAAENGGAVEGLPAVIRHGDSITITAVPESGYEFEGWYIGNQKVSEDAAYSFTAENDADYVARFALKDSKTVKFSVNDETFGSISAKANGNLFKTEAKISAGKEIVFMVVPADGYRVKEWSGLPGGALLSADKLTATIAALDGDVEVEAVLEKIPEYSITLKSAENGKITAEAGGAEVTSVREGTEVTFTAVPNGYYMLKEWTDDAAGQTGNSFKVTVTGNMTVGAVFEKAVYYTVKYQDAAGGTIAATANGENIAENTIVQHVGGSSLKFVAAPDSGKMVKAWKVNGAAQDNLSNTLELELNENVEISIEYEALQLFGIPSDKAGEYSISDIVKAPVDYGTEREVRLGGAAEFKVTPVSGKVITSLNVNSDAADSSDISRNPDGSYLVKLAGVKNNIVLNVQLEDGIALTISDCENGTVRVLDSSKAELKTGDIVHSGDVLSFITTAASGYRLSKLMINGAAITGAAYTVADADTSVIVSAEFEKQSGGGGIGGGGSSSKTYTVTFNSNGGSEVKAQRIAANGVASEPEMPVKEGYTFGGWYSDKELTNQYDFAEKVKANITLYAKWTESSSNPVNPVRVNPFIDVGENDWFYDSVLDAYEKGLMVGVTHNTFEPNSNVTRAMFVTVLYRIEGEPTAGATKFGDVEKGSYYENAVAWAEENSVVMGISETEFAPHSNITREQMAAIIYRYASFKGYDLGTNGALSFTDSEEISEYAKESVKWLTENEIIFGYTDGSFGPKDNSTRAQAAAVFMRMLQNLNKN